VAAGHSGQFTPMRLSVNIVIHTYFSRPRTRNPKPLNPNPNPNPNP